MYSTSDFEKLWFLYQTEGSSKGISINTYCANQGIPAAAYDPCAGMNENDLRNYCRFLFEQVQLKDKQSQEILSQLSEIKDELHRTRIEDAAERKRLFDQVVDLNE